MMKNIIIYLLLLFVAASCGSDASYRRAEGAGWGTTYHIVYRCDRDLSDSVVAEMKRVEQSLSMFDPGSTVSRVNRFETDTVDSYFIAVWNISARVNRMSYGMFDPTVAPLTDLWGFGRDGRETPVPDSAAVAGCLARVGFGRCSLKDNMLQRPDSMEFDFSAVAKGFGVDCVAAMLRRNNCTDYMVEIGGEVSVSGLNPSGKLWRIQIDSPSASMPGDEALGVLELTDCAMATSGNYRNNRSVAPDSVIGHTICPLTGYPRARSVLSATVVAPTCGIADALATACMLLDTVEIRSMINSFPSTSALLCLPGNQLISIP